MSSSPPSPILVDVGEGVELSVLTWNLDGAARPALLVHGLASNATLWSGVAESLAANGHPVAAVDLRGHGHSSKPDVGYDFASINSDLRSVLGRLGWVSGEPVVAGQSWGANVVLDFAAHNPDALSGLVLVDGGTIELSSNFADWPTCKEALTPPKLTGIKIGDFEEMIRSRHPDWPETGIAGSIANMEVLEDSTIRPWLSLDHHLQILRYLWEHRPSELYRLVGCPVTLIVAEDPTNARWMAGKRHGVTSAAAALANCEVRWVRGDHDLHAQFPALVAGLIEATPERSESVPPSHTLDGLAASEDGWSGQLASPGAGS